MLRGLTRRWLLLTDEPTQPAGGAALAPASLIQRVLCARHLAEPGQQQRFREPSLHHLHDPSLMPGIDDAVARLVVALRRDERIVIYGDYDVDGITATAILFHVIRAIAPESRLRCYVPHRVDEGYGINCDALRTLRREGADVAISVDCGISAVESARTAREIGLDLIITDHHLPPTIHPLPQFPPQPAQGTRDHGPHSGLPDAVAVVHPRLPGSKYPFGELCGAGVAFKVAWRLATAWSNSERVGASLQQTLLAMLPLAALGTIADVVPLVDENRVIASFGLRLLRQTPLVGLRALLEAARLADEKIDSEKVLFILAPRLNAAGRMGHAAEAVRMLTDAPPQEAAAIAHALIKLNTERQKTERAVAEHAARLAEDHGMTTDDSRIIVLAHESWHQGVLGIACSRLVDRFGRPTILLTKQGDECKGSARSIDGYSIHDALSTVAPLLTRFGGHDAAAGLTVAADRLAEVQAQLAAHARAHIAPEMLVPALTLDCAASLIELDVRTVRQLADFGPFGRGNRPPRMCIPRVVVRQPPKQMGANGRHLSMLIAQQADGAEKAMRAVWWNAGERAGDFASGMPLDLAIEPKINSFNGSTTVEAEILDVRLVAR